MDETVRILTVDDEPDIRSLLRIMLEGQGYLVQEASSGSQALSLLQAGASFDLILLDILMPGMDGVETARALRKHTLAPILFLTARTRLDDRMAAYRCGGDDFLPKPFSKVELILKVDALLRRYRVYQGKKEQPPEAGIQLDENNRCAIRNGQPVELTGKEFEILKFFLQHQGKLLDIKAVYEGVWRERLHAGLQQHDDGAYCQPAQEAGGGSGEPEADSHGLGKGVSVWRGVTG